MSSRKRIHVDRTRFAAFVATVVSRRADWFDKVVRRVALPFGDKWACKLGHPVHDINKLEFACRGVVESTVLVCRERIL